MRPTTSLAIIWRFSSDSNLHLRPPVLNAICVTFAIRYFAGLDLSSLASRLSNEIGQRSGSLFVSEVTVVTFNPTRAVIRDLRPNSGADIINLLNFAGCRGHHAGPVKALIFSGGFAQMKYATTLVLTCLLTMAAAMA